MNDTYEVIAKLTSYPILSRFAVRSIDPHILQWSPLFTNVGALSQYVYSNVTTIHSHLVMSSEPCKRAASH